MAEYELREYALGTWTSRFLAAGYVVAAITYRSRDVDPQSPDALNDALAAIDYLDGSLTSMARVS